MSYCGFETDRVALLVRTLTAAAQQAYQVSGAVGGCLDEAHDLILSLGGHAPDRAWSVPEDGYRRGLTLVARSGPDVAAEISRRLQHLLACQLLAHEGFAVDLATVFADEPAPTPEQVEADVAELRRLLAVDPGFNGNQDDLQRINDLVAGMSGAEKQAFVGALSAEDLARWNRAATRGDGIFADNGLTGDQVLALSGTLLPYLSRDQVARIGDGLPVLRPSFDDLESDIDGSWTWWAGPLGDTPPGLADLHQGGAGDCWFLSALGAEIQQDPDFVRKHLRDNGNGTYTVTFYRDGAPVLVTVDGALPTRTDGSAMFAHASTGWGVDGPTWMAVYEKAYARLNGSYGAIEGGWGDVALKSLDDRPTVRSSPEHTSMADIETRLASGSPVTVGTTDDSGFWWWQDDDDERVAHQQLVSHHEYRVLEVKQTDHGPLLVVINPWGSGAGAPERVELTEDEYRRWINEVSWSE